MGISSIKKREDFLKVSKNGRKFVSSQFVLQSIENEFDYLRVGYTVTKKVGNAVVRNKIKRRLKNAVREVVGDNKLLQKDYVLIGRKQAENCDYADLKKSLEYALHKVNK